MVGFFEFEELRRPHLVLTDFGRDVNVAVSGQRIQSLDRILRLDHAATVPVVLQAVAFAPLADPAPPVAAVGAAVGTAARPDLEHCRHRLADIANDRKIDAYILVY